MRYLFTLGLLFLLLSRGGALTADQLTGKWIGMFDDAGTSRVVSIDFPGGSEAAGFLVLLGQDQQSDHDDLRFPLAGLTHAGDRLSFAVPVSGAIDSTTLYVDVRLSGKILDGHVSRSSEDGRRHIRLMRVQ